MEANIDKIIEQSMKKTEEIENKLKSLEDKFNLNNVSITGDDETTNTKTTIYKMDGEELTKKKENKLSASGLILDIGPRTKALTNYNLNQNFRTQLTGALSAANKHSEKKDHGEEKKEPNKKKVSTKGWKSQVNGGFDH